MLRFACTFTLQRTSERRLAAQKAGALANDASTLSKAHALARRKHSYEEMPASSSRRKENQVQTMSSSSASHWTVRLWRNEAIAIWQAMADRKPSSKVQFGSLRLRTQSKKLRMWA